MYKPYTYLFNASRAGVITDYELSLTLPKQQCVDGVVYSMFLVMIHDRVLSSIVSAGDNESYGFHQFSYFLWFVVAKPTSESHGDITAIGGGGGIPIFAHSGWYP